MKRLSLVAVLFLVSAGVWADNVGFQFHPTFGSCRVLDTRISGTPLQAGVPFPISGFVNVGGVNRCFIPSTAVAISANITLVGPTNDGFVTLYAGNETQPPPSSNINAGAGTPAIANGTVVRICGFCNTTQGIVKALYGTQGGGTAHLLLDVTGYWEPRSTLFLNITSLNPSTGVVNLRFADLAFTTMPFAISWGDGSATEHVTQTEADAGTPVNLTHTYVDKTRPYTISVVSTYPPRFGLAPYSGNFSDLAFAFVNFQ